MDAMRPSDVKSIILNELEYMHLAPKVYEAGRFWRWATALPA